MRELPITLLLIYCFSQVKAFKHGCLTYMGRTTAQICDILLSLKWEVQNKNFYNRDGKEEICLDFFSALNNRRKCFGEIDDTSLCICFISIQKPPNGEAVF